MEITFKKIMTSTALSCSGFMLFSMLVRGFSHEALIHSTITVALWACLKMASMVLIKYFGSRE